MSAYDRLREIGVSVETADALAPILDGMSHKKVDAFILWACGMTQEQAAKTCGISKGGLWRAIKHVKSICK
jgi:hypothetical protein